MDTTQLQDRILQSIKEGTNDKFVAFDDEHLQIIRNLLEGAELPCAKNTAGESIILELVPRGQREFAKEIGQSVENLDIDEAAAIGDLKRLREILQNNPELINYRSYFNGFTPLHLACGFSSSLETVRYLIENGADIYAISEKGRIDAMPPIIAATLGRDLHILEYLLQKGANPNSQEVNTGVSPLHIAVANQRVEQVKLLLKYQADPNIIVREGENAGGTPIETARKKGYDDILKLLEDARDF